VQHGEPGVADAATVLPGLVPLHSDSDRLTIARFQVG
jgi:hypothetical protein